MKSFVIIATKGRAKETYVLLDYLARQTRQPELIAIVGSEESDVAGLEAHPLVTQERATILLSIAAGLTIQRNAGLAAFRARGTFADGQNSFVAFFDDDFRPKANWLEEASKVFASNQNLIGLSGQVLADGVKLEFGIDESLAKKYISGDKPPENHWTSAEQIKFVDGVYGCNMAFRGRLAAELNFDENLPFYGWQEDYDYAQRALKFGQIVLAPQCKGVHLGVSSGRTSGLRFGYSQIANPVYLKGKGNMPLRKALTLMSKNILSNIFNTCRNNKKKDYVGRLHGNLKAMRDLLSFRLSPLRIKDF